MPNASELIQTHIKRAERVVQWYAQFYTQVDVAEMYSAAYEGLEQAAYRYEDIGKSFWAYARPWVEGKIKDVAKRSKRYTVPLQDRHESTKPARPGHGLMWRAIIAHTDTRQLQIMVGRYAFDYTLQEIADELGISIGRVSQIHGQVLATLRRRIANDNDSGKWSR